ncbi:MAG: hypothetical protein ACFFD4_12975 [Candidatus Odinarchaeota archaeon]
MDYLNNLKSWQKGYLVLILGVPVAILLVMAIGELIEVFLQGINFSGSVPMITATPIFIIIIFGFISGYIANREYFTVFLATITTLFFLIMILGTIVVITGSGWLGLNQSSDPFASIFLALIMFGLVGVFISVIASIILLPSLFLGSFVRNRRTA